jgi:hypothetical protein
MPADAAAASARFRGEFVKISFHFLFFISSLNYKVAQTFFAASTSVAISLVCSPDFVFIFFIVS